MKKYLWLLLCIPLLVTGCKRIPKLADGKEVVLSLGEKQFTAEDFYAALKEQNGVGVLINMVDNYITEQEITEDMKKEAQANADGTYNYYSAIYGSEFETALKQSGFTSTEDFKNYLLNGNKKNLAILKYVKENVVKEDDIKKYYDEKVNGELTVRHILIIPDVTDSMTDTEKATAKAKALEEAKALITQLKASKNLDEDFAALAKQKSEDTGTASQGGLLENITSESGLIEEFYNASLKLQVGAMTTDPIETSYGYHIIYKVSQKEKPSLDDVRNKVIENIATNLLNSDANASEVYWIGLREKYNMTINDDIIKNDYNAIIKDLKK